MRHEVYRRLALVDVAWEVMLGLNLAFYRTFAVPSIGGLLAATGEMTERAQKRADDTGLLMYEIIYHGFDEPRGREAVRRLNRIHRRYPIADDDYRYVLTTFVVVPTRFVDRYGRRRLTAAERDATYAFYAELAGHMAIADIPGSYDACAEFLDAYEQRHFVPHPAGPALIDATRMLLAERFPHLPRRFVLAAGDALLDEPLRRALQVAEPPRALRVGVHLLMRARARVMRLLPAPRKEIFWPGMPTVTYPDGYTVAQLGPADARRG